MLGLAALTATALCNPTMQALLRFSPEYVQPDDLSLLKRAALKRILKISTPVLPLSLALVAAFNRQYGIRFLSVTPTNL